MERERDAFSKMYVPEILYLFKRRRGLLILLPDLCLFSLVFLLNLIIAYLSLLNYIKIGDYIFLTSL